MNKLIVIISLAIVSFTDKISYSRITDFITATTDKKICLVRVSYFLPLSNWSNELDDETSMYDIFYYKDMAMYSIFYNRDSLINGKLVYRKKQNELFLFHKKDLVGYTYYPYSSPVVLPEKWSVDSMLKKHSFESKRFDDLANIKPDSSYYRGDDLVNEYTLSPQPGEYTAFTLYLQYNANLVGIKETFSKKMDTIPGKKLFKILIRPHKEMKAGYPKKDIWYEMKEMPIENPQFVLDYFERFEKEHIRY